MSKPVISKELTIKDYTEGYYQKYIQTLTKENMEQLFIANFGGWSDEISKQKFFDIVKLGFIQLFFIKDRFIGYISYNLETQHKNSYLINDIHIKEEFQQKGYGTEILDHIINKAKNNKIKQLIVLVFKNNPAYDFYKKHQFKETTILEKSFTAVMIKKITDR